MFALCWISVVQFVFTLAKHGTSGESEVCTVTCVLKKHLTQTTTFSSLGSLPGSLWFSSYCACASIEWVGGVRVLARCSHVHGTAAVSVSLGGQWYCCCVLICSMCD